ncbi:MAG TPA: hypothetical protein VGX48_05465 [Pyrinomonadaceae bacterium]|jgi:hypothetical protein|nr:hypothetical protein [Pyrinomonadaceae bacterium]
MWNPFGVPHAFDEGAARVFDRFVEQLLATPQAGIPRALEELRGRVQVLDDTGYRTFVAVLQMKAAQEQQNIERLQATNYDDGFGHGFEAELWRATARISSGVSAQERAMRQQSQARLEGLQFIYACAEQFRAQRPAAPPPPQESARPAAPQQQHEPAPPAEDKQARVMELRQRLIAVAAGGDFSPEFFALLKELRAAEGDAGNMSGQRGRRMDSVIEDFEKLAGKKTDDVHEMASDLQRVQELARGMSDAVADSRPPGTTAPAEGTRAARLVELHKKLTDRLTAEIHRSYLGAAERETIESLFARGVNERKAVYDLDSDAAAAELEREGLRRLAMDLRAYTLRQNLTLAEPVWPSPHVSQNANAVFFSGGEEARAALREAATTRGLKVFDEAPRGEYGAGRWRQLRECHVAVFDLSDYGRAGAEAGVASVCYEMGIALALGRDIVVLASAEGEARTPFDVDVMPVRLSRGEEGARQLGDALDEAVYGQQRGGAGGSVRKTLRHARRALAGRLDAGAAEFLRRFESGETAGDAEAARHALENALALAGPHPPLLLTPAWPGDYPDPRAPMCFHVMPFRENLAEARRLVEEACGDAVEYVRGDMREGRDVVSAIWEDICRATHVVVELTGLNPNVMLELGIADALGRNTLLVTQDDLGELGRVPALTRERVTRYKLEGGGEALRAAAAGFLTGGRG